MFEKTLTMAMLFDFFGELLTEKQREYFDLYYNEDLSLSEIAEQAGISRQGVRDNIVRAENTLRELEDKTGLMQRFTQIQAQITEAETLVQALAAQCDRPDMLDTIQVILEKLAMMKG